MSERDEVWEILGIRQLAATDARAEEFSGTLVVHRPGGEPVAAVTVTVKRTVLVEMAAYLARLLERSRGAPPAPPR